jgi:uncharacterized protein DUF2537
MSAVQLRTDGDRAVLVGGDADAATDPASLPLGTELTDALHEWAKVAAAVSRAEPGVAAGSVVSRRGLQLAARVATSLGVPVDYVDPLTGETVLVEPAAAAPPPRPARRPEPVPWLTGLTVSGASLVLVVVTVVTLATTLAETYSLLAVASNVVVTAGLLPSLWLIHRQPIWRWVAYGVAAGIALSWLALPFVVF